MRKPFLMGWGLSGIRPIEGSRDYNIFHDNFKLSRKNQDATGSCPATVCLCKRVLCCKGAHLIVERSGRLGLGRISLGGGQKR